jgi:hypothetical protein
MNSKAILALALAAVAGVAATAARADDADSSQFAIQFEGNRTRAEVMAEAARTAATRRNDPLGSRVAEPIKSTVDAKVLRAEAAQAVRLGQISRGESSQF